MPTDAELQAELLRQAQHEFMRSQEDVEPLRIKRNQAIADALQAGLSKAEVARITGLGRARIGQITGK